MDETPARQPEPADKKPRGISRRKLLIGAPLVLAGGTAVEWWWDHVEQFQRSSTVIAKAEKYDDSLVEVIRNGLTELGIDRNWVKNKRVLLKPNLVEPNREAPHINTNPAFVRAVAEVFLKWDATEVFVAEGQGHVRDTYVVLEQSGLGPLLDEAGISFIDLNHDDVYSTRNRLRYTSMRELWLPETLKKADLIVSLPKLKTHHWAGATLSMKNFFGVMPGICYGWPKNVLHHEGIKESIVDITATVRPHLAIVDGIVGMEGDGPIMGTPRTANLVVMGTNLPAVDATCVRLMGLNPWRIPYLTLASGTLGPIREEHIEQRGEAITELAQRFELLDHPLFHRFRDPA